MLKSNPTFYQYEQHGVQSNKNIWGIKLRYTDWLVIDTKLKIVAAAIKGFYSS